MQQPLDKIIAGLPAARLRFPGGLGPSPTTGSERETGTSERKVTLTSDGVASGRVARRITARASGSGESEPIRPALALEPVPQFLGRAGAGDPGSERPEGAQVALG
jgi:hypothetical protein